MLTETIARPVCLPTCFLYSCMSWTVHWCTPTVGSQCVIVTWTITTQDYWTKPLSCVGGSWSLWGWWRVCVFHIVSGWQPSQSIGDCLYFHCKTGAILWFPGNDVFSPDDDAFPFLRHKERNIYFRCHQRDSQNLEHTTAHRVPTLVDSVIYRKSVISFNLSNKTTYSCGCIWCILMELSPRHSRNILLYIKMRGFEMTNVWQISIANFC